MPNRRATTERVVTSSGNYPTTQQFADYDSNVDAALSLRCV
ncbi:MAG: hypothetical protein WCI34_07370 [Actinomycetes bacterium]